MKEVQKWSVIFLVDKNPPTRIVLLKRNPNDNYAPSYFTGIGGKIGDTQDYENESPINNAYRELSEETHGALNKNNTNLSEFARCIYKESSATLYYFWSLYEGDKLPKVNPEDGTVAWVSKDGLLDKKIIPTTQAVCQEWSKRKYKLNSPFTIFVKQVGKTESVELIEVQNIEDGLMS